MAARILVEPDGRLDPTGETMRDSPLHSDTGLPGPPVLGSSRVAWWRGDRPWSHAVDFTRDTGSAARSICWPWTWPPQAGHWRTSTTSWLATNQSPAREAGRHARAPN